MNLNRYQTEREWFPYLDKMLWLNHAGSSPLPAPSRDAACAALQDQTSDPLAFFGRWEHVIEEGRSQIARMIHASTDEIAFIKNTTQGIQIAVQGIEWEPGDQVVIPDVEYSTNVYPWWSLRTQGVETRMVPTREGRVVPEDLEAAIDSRTKLLSISWVQYTNGFRSNLKAISQICKKHGVFFLVDIVQGAGALEIDAKETGADLLVAGSHKWLMSPHGAGFLYAPKETVEKLRPVNIGWKSVEQPFDFDRYHYDLLPNAQRFEEGTMNYASLVGLSTTVKLLNQIGIPNIERQILDWTDRLVAELERKGYQVQSPREAEDERSGIVTFASDRISPADLQLYLQNQQIITALRGKGVRISPHFYLNEDDLDRLMKALP